MLKRIVVGIGLAIAAFFLIGCGGLGGQGVKVIVSATHGATVTDTTIEVIIDDGGTDLGGLWYKARNPAVDGDTTTRPAE